MTNRATTVRFPVFDYSLRVILARDLPATGRRLGVDLNHTIAAFIADPVKAHGWIVFPLVPDEATVAHEASHAVRAVFIRQGVRVDNENFAYHLDYLVGKIHKFIRRK